MKFVERTLKETIEKDNKYFKVLLLTGPRQVGKTSLLQKISANRYSYVTLDNLNDRILAQEDPANFIAQLKLPVLIDEVQYAPNIFSYIKMIVDKEQQPGMFWLTGSQQFEMMKNVTESLAGRVAVLKLQGISLAEEQGRGASPAFIPDFKTLESRRETAKPESLLSIYHKIWRGSYPDVVINDGENWQRFYESYLLTYIQRDVQEYFKINNRASFYKFMQIAASRTGQLINYADLARDVGVDQTTIKSWIHVLEASGIIYLLKPYFNNQSKRLIKTAKLYFLDTGLCSFLTGWLNEEVLEKGAMSGAILETYVISEIYKSFLHNGINPPLYFYRDKDKREIDLLIEYNNQIYPIEIKKTGMLKNINIKNFNAVENFQNGAVICFIDKVMPLNDKINAVPIWYI